MVDMATCCAVQCSAALVDSEHVHVYACMCVYSVHVYMHVHVLSQQTGS